MFFKQKGFYISLACGIAAIGAFAALCINMNRSEQKEPVASASNPPQATAAATPETKEASSNHANSEVKEKKTKKRKKKSVQTNAKPAKKQLSFNQEEGLSWPIKGDVLMEYSADKVVYFKTLAQYRTNPALLIEAKEGMDVKASAEGIVESVETSEETGRTVSISIGDGFTVVYGQLKDVSVSKGDMVSELGGCYLGIAQNHLGTRTDVLDCCPKAEGMIMLIRSMSPQVIAVDEIGTVEDIHAIEYAMQCGCRMIASVHGLNMDEASNKPVLGDLIRRRMFQRYVVLGNEKGPGEILGIYDERGSVLCRNL